MATETLRPDAAGTYTQFATQVGAGSYHWDKVDESSADSDTTCVYHATQDSGAIDTFNLPAHAGSGTISKITVYANLVYAYLGDTTASDMQIYVRTHSADYHTHKTVTTSYAEYSWELTTNPNTSEAWTWDEIDALEIGFRGYSTFYTYMNGKNMEYAGSYPKATQVYVVIDYTLTGWANIKNIRAGTGSITATDLDSIWFGTSQVAVADVAEMNGVAV